MKRQKNYTLIFTSNAVASHKKISISQKQLNISLVVFAILAVCFISFLTDYAQLNVDQWKLQSLKKENQKLENKFTFMDKSLKGLESKVQQLTDFSRKLKLITTISTRQPNLNPTGYGKVSFDSQILALSQATPNRQLTSYNEPHKKNYEKIDTTPATTNNEIEIRIEKLKTTNQLIKQDIWHLYSDLLKKQEFINNTPSILPVRGWVSSTYGYRNETVFVDHQPQFHKGLDIATRRGEPVVSSADGKVVYAGYDEFGYGNLLVIDHGYNLKTYYAHLSKIKVETGDFIKRGQEVAAVGNTGKSTGPHLHYEIRIFGQSVNPENYILDDSH